MISATIVTYNEAAQLQKCLKSIHNWVDEIVIVDLGSTDDTKRIAKKFSCRVVSHRFVPYVEMVRNFAIDQCTGDWILILDPDEFITQNLRKSLQKFSKENPSGVLHIPRYNIFFGKWIEHSNFWPDYQTRFFSKKYS